MRIVAAGSIVTLAALLSGCGSDPSVTIDRSPEVVKQALGHVDGKIDMEGLLTSPPVVRTAADNTITYFIKGRGGNDDSRIVFTVEPDEGQATKLSMAVDIARIEATIDGQEKWLSPALVEKALHAQLKAFEISLESGDAPSAAGIGMDRAIAFTALSTDPTQVERALRFAQEGGMADAMAWNGGGPSAYHRAGTATHETEFTEVRGTTPMGQSAQGTMAGGTAPSGTAPAPVGDDW